MDNEDPFSVRVGTFFMVMGAGAFLLFVTSDLADKVDFDFLFIAAALLGIGWYFRREKTPPPSAGRFSLIKKTREDARKRKEDNLKGRQDAKKK